MKFIKDMIEIFYNNKDNIIFDSKYISDLTPDNLDELNNFHAEEVFMINKDDDYFCGIRANHFCIEYGFSELHRNSYLLIITANHKGMRKITVLCINNR